MDDLSASLQHQMGSRLRIPRHFSPRTSSLSMNAGDSGEESELADGRQMEDDEDNASTPRISVLNMSLEEDGSVNRSERDGTLASRLRTLLTHPPRSVTPKAATHALALSVDSEAQSYRDSPLTNSMTPSAARESLKDLFSRALRDPGDTPVKNRRRRSGSFDLSDIGQSPVSTKARVKRLSLSDDEAEKLTKAVSERSFRSSQAIAYDALRERLSMSMHDTSFDVDNSIHEHSHEISLPNRSSTPPAATSTPLRQSVSQFPSQFHGSNLLNENSTMEQAMRDIESDISADNLLANGTVDTRPALVNPIHQSSSRPDNNVSKQTSSSALLANHPKLDTSEHMTDEDKTSNIEKLKNRERERGWNSPLKIGSGRHLNMNHTLKRHGSSVSLSSSGSSIGRSSPASLGGSPGDRNGKHAVHKRADSSDSIHAASTSPSNSRTIGRIRTLSQPTQPSDRLKSTSVMSQQRPSSSLAYTRPSPLHTRHLSIRSESPASSVTSHSSLRSDELDRQHVRERNWNSPHPKWNVESLSPRHESRRSLGSSIAVQEARDVSSNRNSRHGLSGPSTETIVSWQASVPRGAKPTPKPTPKQTPGKSNSVTPGPVGYRANYRSMRLSSELDPGSEGKTSSDKPNGLSSPKSGSKSGISDSDSRVERETLGHTEDRPSSSSPPTPGFKVPSRPRLFSSQIPRITNRQNQTTNSLANGITEQSDERHVNTSSPVHRMSISKEAMDLHDSDLDSLREDEIATTPPQGRSLSRSVPDGTQEANVSQSSESEVYPRGLVTRDNGATHSLILPANFSPPPSPPFSPPDSIKVTPKRPHHVNVSKMAFETPSPPKGMPELPDPPSSSDEVDSDRTPPVRTPGSSVRYADAKTPRPPGAWNTPFTTPTVPRRADLVPAVPAMESSSLKNNQYTPPASFSRATSLALKTPAPPGAWLPTPTNTIKRVQKVRFETAGLSSDTPGAAEGFTDARSDGSLFASDHEKVENIEPPTTPSRRKLGVRIVDAFGNEIVDPLVNPGSRTEVDDRTHDDDVKRQATSIAKRTRIRIVDAMGKEIKEPGSVDSVPTRNERDQLDSVVQDVETKNVERKQAFELLQRTITDLKNDFNQVDHASESTDYVDPQVAVLEEQSCRAREERVRLRYQLETDVQDLRSAQHSEKVQNGVPINSFYFNTRLFWIFMVIVQSVLIVVFYRLSSLGARRLFLTTYIDPFYPELHVHITNPELLGRNIRTSRFTYNTSQQASWVIYFLQIWEYVRERISLLQELWIAWRDPPRTIVWPPT